MKINDVQPGDMLMLNTSFARDFPYIYIEKSAKDEMSPTYAMFDPRENKLSYISEDDFIHFLAYSVKV